jgi:RNA polymerase sigma-70 factor (ECF subfamily)
MATAISVPIQNPVAAVNQAILGDSEGFQKLYETYKTYVYSLCLRMTHNPALSEDLTQDVFFQVWKKISSFKGNSQFRTWLHRVAVNAVLMHIRQRNRRIHTISMEESFLPEADSEPSTTISLDMEDRISLQTVIRRLPPEPREVLTLHEIEGYCHRDISNLMGISSRVSKSQLQRARLRLSTAFGAPKPAAAPALKSKRVPRDSRTLAKAG